MSNRLLELEESLGGNIGTARIAKPTRRRARARKPRDLAPAARPGYAPLPIAPKPAKPTAAARALAAVDYKVPGIVWPIKQPSSMVCWATVTTIMVCWKRQQSMTIETAIGQIGSSWLALYKANKGLLGSQKAPFLTAAGLTWQAPQSLSASGWEALLRDYGPLWVTTDEDPTADFAIHARVMTGIHGDGTESGTKLDIVDPGTGTAYQESFGTFLRKFESEAMNPKLPLRIQIVHWPKDVGFLVTRSLSTQAALYVAQFAAPQETTVDDAEFEPDYDEANPNKPVVKASSAFSAALAGVKKMTAADVRWAADSVSPDYRHLGVAIDTKPFTLTPTVIDRLISCNRFSLDGVESKVVFGLRGCTLDANVTTFTDKIEVREIEPNHIDNRCVIGVFDNVHKKIVAFQASTVPNWEYMERYRQDRSKKANMQPTGRYLLVIGTHRPKKKNAKGDLVDNPNRIQGALRQDQRIVVLRTEDDLTYTVQDTWDETVPNDNIHAGIVAINTGTSTVPDYSSAGCNTVPGASKDDKPSGAWADFRKALGLDNAKPTADDGKRFAYVLLTGREARLMATPSSASITRLRFGSNGADVKALQDALAKHARKYYTGKADGDYGPKTATAFIKYQKDRDSGAADGIVTPTDSTALGFTLAAPPAPVVTPLGILDDVIDWGKKMFRKHVQRAEEGKFKVTSDVAELLHQDTAVSVQWKKTTATLTFKALFPDIGMKDVLRTLGESTLRFKFRLEFEHNGFDIKNARILREIQGSSELKDGKFETTWTAKPGPAGSEVGRIDFLLKGTWDPGRGDKNVTDIFGTLSVEGDGDMKFDLTPNKRVSIETHAGSTWSNKKVVNLPKPNLVKKWHSVFFGVNKHVLENSQLQSIKDWLRTLKPIDPTDTSSPQAVRWLRLRTGQIVVNVEGFASATGKGALNQQLSGKRADAVIKLLRDELGGSAKIERFAHGEDNPMAKQEKEEPNDRRVDIWFLIPTG
jgi:hypothetical protein